MNATATLRPNDVFAGDQSKRASASASAEPETQSMNVPFSRATRSKSTSSHNVIYVPKDTKAWGTQVWISFGIAVFLCGVGLAYLPGADLDRAFMVMGYFFCLSAAFVLSKYVRDNSGNGVADGASDRNGAKRDTPLYGAVVYVAFAAALALTAWGLYRMNVPDSYKAYLLVSWLYLITTTFTLAKTLRDRHEASVAEARLFGRTENDSAE